MSWSILLAGGMCGKGGSAMKEPFDIHSQEELSEMIERNENFDGQRADFAKLKLYQEIKTDLTDFLQLCDDVLRLEEIKPNKYERNALISLDVKIVSTFDKDETAMLTSIMNKADLVTVSAVGGKFIRYSFGVEDVWIE